MNTIPFFIFGFKSSLFKVHWIPINLTQVSSAYYKGKALLRLIFVSMRLELETLLKGNKSRTN